MMDRKLTRPQLISDQMMKRESHKFKKSHKIILKLPNRVKNKMSLT